MDFVLVLLQADQPPAAYTHHQERQEASEHHACDEYTFSTSGQSHENSTPRGCDEYNRQRVMALPGASPQFAAKDGKEPKDLNGE